MSKSIFLVGGGKGGVGKSLLSMTVVDYLDGAGADHSWSRRIPPSPTSTRPTKRCRRRVGEPR